MVASQGAVMAFFQCSLWDLLCLTGFGMFVASLFHRLQLCRHVGLCSDALRSQQKTDTEANWLLHTFVFSLLLALQVNGIVRRLSHHAQWLNDAIPQFYLKSCLYNPGNWLTSPGCCVLILIQMANCQQSSVELRNKCPCLSSNPYPISHPHTDWASPHLKEYHCLSSITVLSHWASSAG